MVTPILSYRLLVYGAISLGLLAGCVAPKDSAQSDDARLSLHAGTKEKSLYEMAVSNEATRLRKENPALSRKEAVAAARENVSFEDYNRTESPQEQKARKLKEAREEFGVEFEKAMRQ